MPNPEKQTKEDEAELKQVDDEIEELDTILKQEPTPTIGHRVFKELAKRPGLVRQGLLLPDRLYTYVMRVLQLGDNWKRVDLMTLDEFLEILNATKDVAKFVFKGPLTE